MLKSHASSLELVPAAPATPDLPEELARDASPPTAYVLPSESQIAIGSYVISIQAKTGFKRLHRIGDCALRPGVDYACFEELGMDEPSTRHYTAKCKHCFRGQVEAPLDVLSDSSASSSNSDSS
mgnify:CR=1 FL=1